VKKAILAISVILNFVWGKDLTPTLKIDVNESVKDMVLAGSTLVMGTDGGKLKVYNLDEKKFTKTVQLPKIKDFMGDSMDTRVASVDYINGKYLMLSDSGIGGYSDLRINENNKTIDIFTEKDKLALVETKFVDDDNILVAFLSDEAALYNLSNKKFTYRVQLNGSKFSNFAFNKNKTLAAFASESGEVVVIEPKSGKIIKRLNGINLDNIFKVDIKKDIVTTAGKDRRAGWYNLTSGKKDFIQANFFIYATALSPDACMAAFAMDENNNITIVNLSSKSKLFVLKGQKSTLNSIIFKDNSTVFAASDDTFVSMWKLK